MRDETISKNYAETLLELALREELIEEYGDALATVAQLLDEDAKFLGFMETPRIDDTDRKAVVQKVFGTEIPRHVLNFVLVTIDKRRQRLLREISQQYNALVDERLNREHVSVTLARSVDEDTKNVIADRLSDALRTTAIPHFRVKPDIIGGLVIRTSDTIYDGSIRRRLDGMRRQLLHADLPSEVLGDVAM